MQKKETKDRIRTEHLLLIVVIAAFTSSLWRFILGVPPFEELWWAHFAPVGVMRPHSYELGITFASCITWGWLSPFLYKSKAWAILPVAVLSPFVWALLVSLGWVMAVGFGHFGFTSALGGLFMRGLAAFVAWLLTLQPARVIFPISLLAAALIWLSLNKFDPDAFFAETPAANGK